MTRRACVFALALFLLPLTAWGQRPALEIALPPTASLGEDGPAIRALNVLSERNVRDLLRNGFPARLHFRTELWSTGGPFNSRLRTTEWYVVVRYDALRERYEAVRLVGDSVTQLGKFTLLNEAVQELEKPYRPRIAGEKGHGRQYYYVTLELEMMSVSDLDEVERWLRGELRPAVRGEKNPGTAIGRGMRTLLVRLLGGESRTIELRSKTFKP